MILGHWGSFSLNLKEKPCLRQGTPVFLDEVIHQKGEDDLSLSLIATGDVECLTHENVNHAYNVTDVPLR